MLHRLTICISGAMLYLNALLPFAHRPPQKIAGRPPTPKLLKSPGAEDPGNLRPVRITPESSNSSTPTRAQEEEEEQVLSPLQPRPQPLGQNKASTEQTATTPLAASGQLSLSNHFHTQQYSFIISYTNQNIFHDAF